jgi:hypothetical protein
MIAAASNAAFNAFIGHLPSPAPPPDQKGKQAGGSNTEARANIAARIDLGEIRPSYLEARGGDR